MIIIEIYALQWERRIELKVDEGIRAEELCRCIAGITGDKDKPGYVISCESTGVIPEKGRLADYGVKTGTLLLYISCGEAA